VTAFTRLTVVGTTHRCELVVPSEEVLGAVLPRMLELVHEPAGPVTRPLRMVLPTGDQLDVARTPADQRLRDGAVVRLVRADEAPPPPQVVDVTDVLGDDFADRPDLWSARARTVTGSVALAALGAAGAGLVPATTDQRLLTVAGLLVLTVLTGRLAAARATAPRADANAAGVRPADGVAGGVRPADANAAGVRPADGVAAAARAAALALTGLVLGVAAVTALRLALAPGVTATGWVLPVAIGLGLLGWTCAGAGLGLGLGNRPVLAGSALGLAAAAVPLAAAGTGADRAAALGATFAVLACGLLPRYAAAAAGLTALDTALLGGRSRPRRDVRQAVDRTYASLTWSVFGVSWTLAATGGVLLGSADLWAAGLGVAVGTVTALRTRAFPLAAQQGALWAAVVAALVVGGYGRSGLEPPALLAGLAVPAVAVLALVLVRPPEHTRAALRQAGDAVEVVAVVALVPLLLGLFGVYADLLGTFR
jgi:WXG100 protein secretion system (Wss), protein YukD